jgi:ferric-dicitrate binding protein FerR (iron transport regulator)
MDPGRRLSPQSGCRRQRTQEGLGLIAILAAGLGRFGWWTPTWQDEVAYPEVGREPNPYAVRA